MHNFYCIKCGSYNGKATHTCINCGETLIQPNSDIQSIKDELLAIKLEYDSKIDNLLNKIELLDAKKPEIEDIGLEHIPSYSQSENDVKDSTTIEDNTINDSSIVNTIDEDVINDPSIANTIEDINTQEISIDFETTHENHQKKQKTKRKSIFKLLKSIPFISILLEMMGSPFASVWDYLMKIYTKYKDKNQLPVFFMTMAGVGALLFGFGYLMQLSIGYFGELSEIVKILFGFASSIAITFWATKLYKKEDKYKDFSSALIGLSVSMNYLFVYFLTDISGYNIFLSSSILGFALIIANTVFAIFFALKYETKIVAILSLLGGSFAPFYLNSDDSSITYFAYLWVLSLSSIYVANKIKWKTLGAITFVTSSSIIELAIFDSLDSFSLIGYTVIFHAFAYLFIWFSLFEGKKLSETLNKTAVILIATNISIFLFNLYFLFNNSELYTILGIIYLVNSLLFFPTLWVINKQASKQSKLLILVISGTFVALAIPALFDKHLIGLFWSIESLGLVFLGYIYSIPSVRKEGYLLLLIAILKILISFDGLWFVSNSEILFTLAYFNLVILGIIIGIVIFLLYKFRIDNLKYENKLSVFTRNIASVWFLTIYIITASFFTINWLAFTAVLSSFIVITVGFKFKLRFSKLLGLATFIASVLYSSIFATIDIIEQWNNNIYSVGYANLGGIGLYLVTYAIVMFAIFKKNNFTVKKEIRSIIRYIYNTISIWFTIIFLVTSFYFIEEYTYVIAIIPMFGLIYLGNKNKLIFSEYLGLGYSIIIIIGIITSAIEMETLRFSKQLLWGKITMVELMFTMWFLKAFYNKLLNGNKNSNSLNRLREIFYWIIPLTIISPVKHNFPDFIPVALWLSTLISFAIFEVTKRKSLVVEFTILAAIAAITGLTSGYYYAIPVSLVVLAVMFIRTNGYKINKNSKIEFTHIFIPTIYYIGASIFVVSSEIFNSISIGFIMSSLYFSIIVIFRDKIILLKNNYLVSFWGSLVLSVFAILSNYVSGSLSDQVLSFIPLIPIGLLLYGKNTVYHNKKTIIWIGLITIFNIMVLATYAVVLSDTQITIALIIHAIIVLFYSMKLHYKFMVWLSVALFVITIIKLIFWDIAHFNMLQKVIVFIVIGALLIGASFLYVKLKERFEKNDK